ncbi:MAG: sodium/glutamate symporter [Thermodesulfobacteriota bacterium]
MQTPFSFDLVISFGLLSLFLLLGFGLRAKIRFFQNYLIPSCLIGGFSGLVILNAAPVSLDIEQFEAFTYHFFIISFISVGLTAFAGNNRNGKKEAPTVKGIVWGVVWGGTIQGLSVSVQSLLGCSLVFLFAFFGFELFPTFGFFAPLGFMQGPGQAISFGKVWEGFGFENAATIGLVFASMGFLFAFFVGVPLVNWGIKKIKDSENATVLPEAFLKGYFPQDGKREAAGLQTTHSANLDALAFQAALVGMVYLFTYGFVRLLNSPFSESVGRLNWGFTFFYGLLVALLTGWLMKKTGINHLIDEGVQKRITGWSIDFLIIATIFAIKPAIVVKFIAPILVIGLSTGIITTVLLVYFGKRLGEYNVERMVLLYGTCTGTLSSGLLLLRIVDPKLDSPVALEAGVLALGAMPFILPSMLLINAKFLFGWEIWHIMLAFTAMLLFCLVLLKVTKLWGKPKF